MKLLIHIFMTLVFFCTALIGIFEGHSTDTQLIMIVALFMASIYSGATIQWYSKILRKMKAMECNAYIDLTDDGRWVAKENNIVLFSSYDKLEVYEYIYRHSK